MSVIMDDVCEYNGQTFVVRVSSFKVDGWCQPTGITSTINRLNELIPKPSLESTALGRLRSYVGYFRIDNEGTLYLLAVLAYLPEGEMPTSEEWVARTLQDRIWDWSRVSFARDDKLIEYTFSHPIEIMYPKLRLFYIYSVRLSDGGLHYLPPIFEFESLEDREKIFADKGHEHVGIDKR